MRTLTAAAALVLAGCSSAEETPPPGPPSAVLGMTADLPLREQIRRLEITAEVPSEALTITRQHLVEGGLEDGVELEVPPVAAGTRLIGVVDAFDDAGHRLLRRKLETHALDGRVLLLPLRLNDECLARPGEPDVACPLGTCVAGYCDVAFVSPSALPDHAPDWSAPRNGDCGPIDAGEPVVSVGRPSPPFEVLADGDVVTPQLGHQGASHFFLSVRMRNADGATAITTTYGRILSTGRERSPVKIAQRYETDQGGCTLWDIPFVLPPEDLTDQAMRLGITVSDVTGNAGHVHVDIVLAAPLPP